MEYERQPLSVDGFAANLQMHVKPESPPQMKMMAAKGMVPAPPAQQVQVLYNLHFDSAVAKAATESMAQMPANVLIGALQQVQPEGVLDWIAELRAEAEILNAVALNKSAHDATIWRLAKQADAHLCEVIANNQVRMLRSPEIIEALYTNTNARMATVDKLIDLARRNEVNLTKLPGLSQALKSGADLNEGGLDDATFEALLGDQGAKAAAEEEKLRRLEDENLTRSEREALEVELVGLNEDEEESPATEKRGNLHSQIGQMNIAQKVRLSTVGSREAIKLLIRDSNKLIHMAAIQSPRIQMGDVRQISANKSLPEGVIKYIASNRDWTRHYDVMSNLTMNPKTPLADVMNFVNHLRTKELRQLSRSRNVPSQVSRVAKQLLNKRGMR
jgi:hypothetical protein